MHIHVNMIYLYIIDQFKRQKIELHQIPAKLVDITEIMRKNIIVPIYKNHSQGKWKESLLIQLKEIEC